MPPKERAYEGLIKNRRDVIARFNLGWIEHTPPSEHYPHRYKWDSAFFTLIYTAATELFLEQADLCKRGEGQYKELQPMKRAAKLKGLGTQAADAQRRMVAESFSIFQGQHETGMIPNIHFTANGRATDPERRLAFEREAKGSNYDQPPVTAVPILAAYEMLERSGGRDDPELFLEELYMPLKKHFDFWESRFNSESEKLIGIIHPHETGRDSDPTFDIIKPLRFKRKGKNTSQAVDTANALIDYGHILKHGIDLKKAGGDIAKQRELFWVNDVMMNCILVDNLLAMSRLAAHSWRPQDVLHYKKLAAEVEQEIIAKMYDEEDKTFYALDQDGEKIKEVSISNLFPLVLPNLPAEQLKAVLDLMDEGFNTNFPLPSVATFSPNYDPHNQEKERLWRGSTWINANFYLVEYGLLRQCERKDLPEDLRKRCRKWAEKITISSYELVTQHGAYEHYDPEKGDPQRTRVENFGWSYLALIMQLVEELGLENRLPQPA